MPEKILGSELPQEAFSLLKEEIYPRTTVVIATVDQDGNPRTAPFWIAAKDRKTLRVYMRPWQVTYQNIKRDGRVMVCVVEEGNTAIGIKGRAKFITDHVVEIKIEEVKSDAIPWMTIMHGVRFNLSEQGLKESREVSHRLKEAP